MPSGSGITPSGKTDVIDGLVKDWIEFWDQDEPIILSEIEKEAHQISSEKEIQQNRCTCGVESVGSGAHSSWCDLEIVPD